MGFLHQDWKFWKMPLAVLRLSRPPRERAEERIPVQQACPGEHAIGLVDGVTVSESLNRNRDPEMRVDRAAKLFAQRVQGRAVLDTLGPEPDVEPLEHWLRTIILMVDSRPHPQRRLD